MFFDNSPEQILAYLQELLPGYPYRADLDAAFIGELAADFPDLDILEEIKSFRWYPYRADLDAAFIGELAADFPDLDILEEIKSFRWYYDNAPLSRVKNVRVALRRWIANANGPRYR